MQLSHDFLPKLYIHITLYSYTIEVTGTTRHFIVFRYNLLVRILGKFSTNYFFFQQFFLYGNTFYKLNNI